MKFFVVLAIALACVAADVKHINDDYAPIVKSSYDIGSDGSYQYSYETGNGIVAQAQGVLKDPKSPNPSQVVQGAYKYVSPEGTSFEVSYTADEEGFKPQGSHLPVPPPIPEAIARSLAYIAAHPPAVQKP
nr:larval cuticle protein 17 [Hyphantria cunea]